MRSLLSLGIAILFHLPLYAQPDFTGVITQGSRRFVAVPDFPGAGPAQRFMGAFNDTLWSDLEQAALFQLVPKSLYYKTVPTQPSEFRTRASNDPAPSGGGWFISDWSSPPTSSDYLVFGYADVRHGTDGDLLVLHGWLFDVKQPSPATAQLFGKFYLGPITEAGARKIAHEFAADLILRLGGTPLYGTTIYFRSNRTGQSEIWAMDWDGSNQRQITHLKNILLTPAVSPDGATIAFTSFAEFFPKVFVFSVAPPRRLRFDNPDASLTKTPSFTSDGKQILYASSVGHGCCRLFIANRDGSNPREISPSDAINAEPKINPRNANELAFVSGRSGPQQIYRINLDGTDLERLTPGNGEASNPSWHPDGQHLAFAWTQGYASGDFNIFLMEVASGKYLQLTHEGRNENPSWAPDGLHIVFGSTRSGSSQIWSMLGDGTGLRQLTGAVPGQGKNDMPAWSK